MTAAFFSLKFLPVRTPVSTQQGPDIFCLIFDPPGIGQTIKEARKMIKIEIPNAVAVNKQVTSHKTGKDYTISEQEGWAYFHDREGRLNPHPSRVRITLDRDQQPYPVGNYTLSPESLYADQWGQICVRPRLRLIPQAQKAAA